MTSANEVAQNLVRVRASIDVACLKAKRKTQDVRLLAVSKTQPIAKIEEAYACGVRDFGENYMQELAEKKEKLAHLEGIRWHLIGHLQSNKAKLAVASMHFFHALDSEKIAIELEKQAIQQAAAKISVFIQVNVDDEETKSGASIESLESLVALVRSKPAFDLRGLMCIPEKESEPAFEKMAALKKELGLAELSMGMSADFESAIVHGANWVRVGRALFGERRKEGV